MGFPGLAVGSFSTITAFSAAASIAAVVGGVQNAAAAVAAATTTAAVTAVTAVAAHACRSGIPGDKRIVIGPYRRSLCIIAVDGEAAASRGSG